MSAMKGMLQRCWHHDYHSRSIYMITVVTAGRVPYFGCLACGAERPEIVLSEYGRIIKRCWHEIPARFPGVSLREYQIMPDHFHGIIFVERQIDRPLGAIIGFFKAHSTSLARGECSPQAGNNRTAGNNLTSGCRALAHGAENAPHARGECSPQAGNNRTAGNNLTSGCRALAHGTLWSPGYQDTILLHKGQLENMVNYIRDNPRRLAVKRANREYFEIVRDCKIGDITVDAIGNQFLLRRPIRLQVKCSRSITPQALAEKEAFFISHAEHGAVLVSPCISPGEKQIARAALARKLPLIVLVENGFPQFYKPPKTYFEACAQGYLLMLAPWAYHAARTKITREQCNRLNALAQCIARG